MKQFKDIITVAKNSRGCYILDTVKGCSICKKEKPKGCYNNCYAKAIADRYNIDFTNPISRDFVEDKLQLSLFDFKNEFHVNEIIKTIKNIDMPFIRIGEMGDPSENWWHTIKVCDIISHARKPIVIITKHWKEMPDKILESLWHLDLYINTSISAMDSNDEIEYRLGQYNRLKPYCKSVLRIVSCDFNENNPEGARMSKIQKELFNNANIIDTVFRPNKNNKYVTDNIINVTKTKFLRSSVLASVYNKNVYLGICSKCPDMCGLNV